MDFACLRRVARNLSSILEAYGGKLMANLGASGAKKLPKQKQMPSQKLGVRKKQKGQRPRVKVSKKTKKNETQINNSFVGAGAPSAPAPWMPVQASRAGARTGIRPLMERFWQVSPKQGKVLAPGPRGK